MAQTIKATFQNGVFVPQVPCDLPENTEADVVIRNESTMPPLVADVEERKRILARMVERMNANPLPTNAPRFTRDELHERR